MTKQDKIKEAYGEYWDRLDNYQQIEVIDDDGKFYEYDVVKNINSPIFRTIIDSIDCVYDFDNDSLIPLSIENIFNNNGWIKIESEDDLPKEDYGQCFIMHNGDVIYGGFSRYSKNNLHFFDAAGNVIVYESITHYQQIVQPKPPIY